MNCVGPINSKSLVALKSCAVSLQLLLVIENGPGQSSPDLAGPGVARVGSDGSSLKELVQTRARLKSKFTRVSSVIGPSLVQIFFFFKKKNCELFLEAETGLFLFSPIRSESRRDTG